MLKSKTGEFDIGSIHTLCLSDHGEWFFITSVCYALCTSYIGLHIIDIDGHRQLCTSNIDFYISIVNIHSACS